MTDISTSRFMDLRRFGQYLMATKDIDPVYPLMKHVIQTKRLSDEGAHWLVFVYLSAYNTATAWAIFTHFPWPGFFDPFNVQEFVEWERGHRKHLHLNIERRGLRGGKIIEALAGYSKAVAASGQRAWLERAVVPQDPRATFLALWDHVQTLPHVGRWAAFKWLDLLKHVLDYPIEFTDMRMEFCSGPRQALEELYLGQRSDRQDPTYIHYLDALGERLRDYLGFAGLMLTYDELETVLCNFHSVMHGRYYVGHDIDEHQRDLEACPLLPHVEWWEARHEVLDQRLLGERNGWHGVRKDLCRLYKERGVVYCGWETHQ